MLLTSMIKKTSFENKKLDTVIYTQDKDMTITKHIILKYI